MTPPVEPETPRARASTTAVHRQRCYEIPTCDVNFRKGVGVDQIRPLHAARRDAVPARGLVGALGHPDGSRRDLPEDRPPARQTASRAGCRRRERSESNLHRRPMPSARRDRRCADRLRVGDRPKTMAAGPRAPGVRARRTRLAGCARQRGASVTFTVSRRLGASESGAPLLPA